MGWRNHSFIGYKYTINGNWEPLVNKSYKKVLFNEKNNNDLNKWI